MAEPVSPKPAQAANYWQSQWANLQQQKSSAPMDRNLTATEHDAFSRALIERFGPVAGRLLVGTAVPTWQAAKAIMQPLAEYVPGARSAMDAYLPESLQPHRGSAPGFDQLRSGLAPIFESDPTQPFNVGPSMSSVPTEQAGPVAPWGVRQPAQAEETPMWSPAGLMDPKWEGRPPSGVMA